MAARILASSYDSAAALDGGAPEHFAAPAAACELLGKFGSFGWWVQGFLAFVCFLSLVGKRFTDKVRRPWKVWFFDTSKQGFQGMTVHLLNIGLSWGFGKWLDTDADACNWYWINLTLDCTLGVAVLYVELALLRCFYRSKYVGRAELANTGVYGNPPELRLWARQLWDWQVLVVCQKLLMMLLVLQFSVAMASFADALLGWLDPYPRGKLVVVMVISPLVMNVFALWTADSFLQADSGSAEDCRALVEVQGSPSKNWRGRTKLGFGSGPSIVGQRVPSSIAALNEDLDGDESDGRVVSFSEWKRRAIMFGRSKHQHEVLGGNSENGIF